MEIQNDFRKTHLLIGIGISLIMIGIYLHSSGLGGLAFLFFFIPAGFIFIALASFIRKNYAFKQETLIISNIFGLFSNVIHLDKIDSYKSIDKPWNVPGSINIISLIWRDPKFKRTRRLKIFCKNKLVGTIDCHFLKEEDYEKIKKLIKKNVLENKNRE